MFNFLLTMMAIALLIVLFSSLAMMFDIEENTYYFFTFVLILGICLAVISIVLALFFLF